MTRSLDALARQMDSMDSIHSVVHTMKTLSVINAAPYDQAARAIEAYHETVLDGLRAFLVASRAPLPPDDPDARQVLIVFGSDHGLCGNYNDTIASHVRAHMADRGGDNGADAPQVMCIGAQMADALRDRGLDPQGVFLPPASIDGLGRLANLLTQKLDQIRTAAAPHDIAVALAYSARHADGRAPRIVPLLPIDASLLEDLAAAPWQSRSRPRFSMPAPDLLRALIRSHVFASLVRAAAEAMVTENAARLALMQQAEQSVEDRLDALKAEANALRQSGITTELLDVITGFETLKQRVPKASKDAPSRKTQSHQTT